MKYLLLGLALQFAGVFSQTTSMFLMQSWKQIDFNFPTKNDRDYAIQNKLFVPANVFPIDVDVDYHVPYQEPRTFVTFPRFNDGVPATLGYVPNSNSHFIQPYPNYSWHLANRTDCNGITSAFRVAIDSCFQMWVLDSGVIGSTQKCPPQLLVFDLKTDKLLRRYQFPKSQYVATSLFITPVLDTKDPGYCTNTKVYIADITGYALIVYDSITNKSWKIQNNLFKNDPVYSKFTIAGESFNLDDGILGMAVSPPSFRTDRKLYFHSLAGSTENSVLLNVINEPSNWDSNPNALPTAFQTIGNRGIQTPAEAMDSNGNLFFVLLNPLALVCWDSSRPYSRSNIKIVYQNNVTLQFASGLKVVRNYMGVEEVWIMTNRFQKIAAGTMSASEVNYRVQSNTVSLLLNYQTRCNGKSLP